LSWNEHIVLNDSIRKPSKIYESTFWGKIVLGVYRSNEAEFLTFYDVYMTIFVVDFRQINCFLKLSNIDCRLLSFE